MNVECSSRTCSASSPRLQPPSTVALPVEHHASMRSTALGRVEAVHDVPQAKHTSGPQDHRGSAPTRSPSRSPAGDGARTESTKSAGGRVRFVGQKARSARVDAAHPRDRSRPQRLQHPCETSTATLAPAGDTVSVIRPVAVPISTTNDSSLRPSPWQSCTSRRPLRPPSSRSARRGRRRGYRGPPSRLLEQPNRESLSGTRTDDPDESCPPR